VLEPANRLNLVVRWSPTQRSKLAVGEGAEN